MSRHSLPWVSLYPMIEVVHIDSTWWFHCAIYSALAAMHCSATVDKWATHGLTVVGKTPLSSCSSSQHRQVLHGGSMTSNNFGVC